MTAPLPAYTVYYDAALDLWQVRENGKPIGWFADEAAARAVCQALKRKYDSLILVAPSYRTVWSRN